MKNIVSYESNLAPMLTAKTCSSFHQRDAKVVYSFVDYTNQIFFVDKRNILNNQLEACHRLLSCISEVEKAAVEKEIIELRRVLDLMQ
jgi:hypothetical protein